MVLGSPLGLEQTVSDGMVSAIRTVRDRGEFLQISAPISPGSSGGPVVNMTGQIIGIVSFQVKGQNINFAVPGYRILALRAGPPRPLPGPGAEGKSLPAAPRGECPPPPDAGAVRTVPVGSLTGSLTGVDRHLAVRKAAGSHRTQRPAMKKKALTLLWLILFLGATCSLALAGSIRVYFSPNGGCTDAILCEINQAKTEILLQAYSFTSKPIAQALIRAQKRGVRISAVLDKSNRRQKYSAATFLKNMGIPVFIDDKHAIAHNKIMIIDNRVVITGSFNFTMAAENKNAENVLILDDLPDLTRAYRENFQNHLRHSMAYLGLEE